MLRKFLRRFFITLYILLLILFLSACLSPFLNPSDWWFFGFLGLIFPYLLILLVVSGICWLFIKPRLGIAALICMLIGWKSVSAVFAFHFMNSFDKEKKEQGTLRVMTWNLRDLYPYEAKITKGIIDMHHQKIFSVIRTYNADVLAIQEFSSIDNIVRFNNIAPLQNMGYKYYYFSRDFSWRDNRYSGTAIFSKYPIIDSAKVYMSQKTADGTESLLHADIIFNNDTIRIFTGHLQSFRFMQSDYKDISKIKNDPDERLGASKNIFRKMRVAFQKRGVQTDLIRKELDGSLYPEVFCGDLNDVPNSYAYFSVKGDKKDAFIAKGAGFGKTFYSLSSGFMRRLPTLRIDYIFTDPRFDIIQVRRIPEILSDHIPVIADIKLRK